MDDEITIQQRFPDALRSAAAELCDAVFGAKLAITIPNPISRAAVLKVPCRTSDDR